MIDNYTRLLKIQEFSEELIKLQERIAAIDNEILISEKNIELEKEKIEQEKEKISTLLSKKKNNLLKIKQINIKANTIKNEIAKSNDEKYICVGYVRLSKKGEQNFERQYHTIYDSNFIIVKTFKEITSAHNTELSKRILNDCIDYCFDSGISLIVISEATRLSRSVQLFKEICAKLIDKCINVYSCSERIYLFDNEFNITDDFYNKIIYAEKEAEQINNRLMQGRELYKSNGGILGRRVGSCKTLEQLEDKYTNQIKLLRDGVSIRKVAHRTGVSVSTIQRLKRKFNITTQKQNNKNIISSIEKPEIKNTKTTIDNKTLF